MTLKSPLELEVYYISQDSMQLSELGIDHDDKDDCEVRQLMLYSVDHIVKYPYEINFKPATRLQSGGTDYLVNMDYESLKTLINESTK